MYRAVTLAACLALFLAVSVPAQPPPACQQDLRKHCSGVRPGGGRLLVCLKAHQESLSPDCQKAMASVTPRPDNRRQRAKLQACRGDMEKFCREVPKGKGAGLACLNQHQAELSDPCKAALAK